MLVVLAHPRWLVLALGGFLVRGGLLVLLAVILPIPTTAGLANALGPALVGFVFGGPSPAFLVLVGSVVVALLAWLVLGGALGAWLDLELIREALDDEDLVQHRVVGQIQGFPRRQPGPWRALLVRLLAHVPTAAVIAWGSARLVDQGYQELIHPGDPTLPVAVRVILRVPDVVGLLVAAWVVGEAVGGLAIRQLAFGRGPWSSLPRAAWSLVRPSGLLVLVVTNAGVATILALAGAAVALAYDRARFVLLDGLGGGDRFLALLLLSAIWIGSFVLVGLGVAWRSTAWTAEVAREYWRPTDHPDDRASTRLTQPGD